MADLSNMFNRSTPAFEIDDWDTKQVTDLTKIGKKTNDIKIRVSRTREDGSTEIIWEVGLEELYVLQQAFPHHTQVEAEDYDIAITIGKWEYKDETMGTREPDT